jgi:hypothetical protein
MSTVCIFPLEQSDEKMSPFLFYLQHDYPYLGNAEDKIVLGLKGL